MAARPSPDHLHNATLGSLPNRVRVVGVASSGQRGRRFDGRNQGRFRRAIGHVKDWLQRRPDLAASRPGHVAGTCPRDVTYSSAAIPFRDFPFGMSPASVEAARRATGATISERSGSSRPPASTTREAPTSAIRRRPAGAAKATTTSRAICHTSRRAPAAKEFDPARRRRLGRLPARRRTRLRLAGFRRTRRDVSPVVRRRADLPRSVRATQYRRAGRPGLRRRPVHGRALSGEAGQRFQGFLRAAGLTKRYLILRTLPVDTLDLTAGETARRLVDKPRSRHSTANCLVASAPRTAVRPLCSPWVPALRRLAPTSCRAG